MEQTDANLTQQKWLYQKLLKIIPNLPEHLQMGIIELEGKVEGDRMDIPVKVTPLFRWIVTPHFQLPFSA